MAGASAPEVVVVGGGHNGLVAATLLARAGRSVQVLERLDRLGGAAVSGTPFPGVDARLSRYAYLVSLFPPALSRELGLSVELRRRRVAWYADGRLASEQTRDGDGFGAIASRLAERVFPTLLEPLRSREGLRRIVDDDETWSAIFERPLSDLLERSFASDSLRGVALTDAVIGTFAPADDPLLRQNRCFLYHVVGGPWTVPVGGMGALTGALERAARTAGVSIRTGAEVVSVATDGGRAEVRCADGTSYPTADVVAGVAPSVLARLLDEPAPVPPPEGAQMKLNMIVSRLPALRDGRVSPLDAFAGTFHVNEGYEQLQSAYRASAAGRLPDPVPCELYCHSLTDPSILSAELQRAGAQTLTVFTLHTPARLFASGSVSKREAVAATLRSVNTALAEPLEDCLWRDATGAPCLEALTPPELEAELAMPGGHIFHRDLSWPFAETPEEVGTWGVETARPNVWICGAGARRGGAVSGIPGHNAAQAVLAAGT